jgi:hypothetical protein
MESVIQVVSYFSLGILFFAVVWSIAEEVIQGMFGQKMLGQILGFLIATYGFWYPLMPILRISYVVMLSGVAVVGTGVSRIGIVAKWAIHGRCVIGIVAGLILVEGLQYVVREYLEMNPCGVVAAVVSWGLLVYGIVNIQEEFIGPVVKGMELPRATLIQTAFVLACVVFLPLEVPVIYVLMHLGAIVGSLFGWGYIAKDS